MVEFYPYGTAPPNHGTTCKYVQLPRERTAKAYAQAIEAEIRKTFWTDPSGRKLYATIAQYSSDQNPLTGFFCFMSRVEEKKETIWDMPRIPRQTSVPVTVPVPPKTPVCAPVSATVSQISNDNDDEDGITETVLVGGGTLIF